MIRKKRGRPTKFDSEIASRIVQLVRAGNYIETAACAAGINKDTLYEWMKTGMRAGKGQLYDFADAVQKGVGEAEAMNLSIVGKAAVAGAWQAAAWRLERCHPDRYAMRQRIDHASSDGGPLNVSIQINRKVKP